MEKDGYKQIVRIRTAMGREIKATADHPILTNKGMVVAGSLSEEDVLVSGSRGIEYTLPMKNRVVSEEMISETLSSIGVTDIGNARVQVLNFLRKRNLCELDTQDHRIKILLKLLGFVFGDSTIPNIRKGCKYTTFYGKEEDLSDVKKDIEELRIRVRAAYQSETSQDKNRIRSQ